MPVDLDEYVLSVFLVLCRIGACLMQLPGFSSARVPARVRLFIAIALAFIVTPMLSGVDTLKSIAPGMLLATIFAECLVGTSVGLVSRVYVAALEFAASAISNFIGLSGLGTGIDHDEPAASVSTLITVAATAVLLILDFHRIMITVLVESYITVPVGAVPNAAASLRLLVDTLGSAFMLGVQVSGPFIIYGILVNLMFGILGKLIPQVPSYFISVPFLAIGGLVIIYFSFAQMMVMFARATGAALSRL
jgi:flagellar biosynthesis protein FliR